MNDEAHAGLQLGNMLTGPQLGPILAGLLGAMLSMRAIANAPLSTRLTSMLAASGAAGYLTPALAEWWGLSANLTNAAAFFVGLLILNITAGLLELSGQFAKNPVRAAGDLIGLVFRWRTGQAPSEPRETHEPSGPPNQKEHLNDE